MKKNMKTILGYLLTICLVCGSISLEAVATEQAVTEQVVSEEVLVEKEGQSYDTTQAEILYELAGKRDETTKYFAMSDGTIKACIYPQNVHYLENGKYQEIDNTLIEATENDKVYYKNKKNGFSVKMPEQITDDYIEFSDENGYVKFKLQGASNKKIEKLENEHTKNNVDKTTVKNVNDKAIYKAIKGDVDIEYDLAGNKLKETIVLYKKTKNSFVFDVQTSASSVEVNTDNSISFFDSEGIEIYMIASPYMTDSAGEYSNAVETQLKKTESGYTLIYSPNYEWLSDKEREYPVKIDPTLFQAIYKETVTDTYVSNVQTSNDPDIRGTWDVLNIGRRKTTLSSGTQLIKRGLIRFEIPSEIKKTDCIIDAKLDLVHYTVSSAVSVDGIQIDVHELTSGFIESGTWWGNQPSYNSSITDYAIVDTSNTFSGSTLSYDSYNITRLVNKWHNGGTNYGIMLKLHDETTTVTSSKQVYYFAKQSKYYGSVSKFVEITYRNTTGLEDYWNYTMQDIGEYGAGYVNNYNGNLVYAHDDVFFHSLINGFTLSHVYNTNLSSEGMGYYGAGWRLNFVQKFEPVTVTGNSSVKYVYTDGDGTQHYFVQTSDNKIVDEDGLGLTFTDIDSGELQYQLTDKDDNILKFDKWYYLRQIIDPNGNTLNLNYSQTGDGARYLTSITTSSGGSINLSYNSNYKLTQISDNAGRITKFVYSGEDLLEIIYPDGREIKFTYSNHRITVISYPGEQSWNYTYENNGRVKTVSHKGSTNLVGQNTTFAYYYNQTIATDAKNRNITYQFDTFGRATCVYDDKQNIYSQSYTNTTDGTNIFQNNKISLSSNGAVYINNLLKNPVFSDGLTNWTQYKNESSAQISITTDDGLLTSNTVKMSSENNAIAAILQYPSTYAERTYTLSGYIKTDNVQSEEFGAGLEFVKTDGVSSQYIYSDFILGSTDNNINGGYQRISMTVTLAENETIKYISAGLYAGTGTVWIDSLQLETGETANQINLLENSSFEYNNGSNTMPDGCAATFAAGTDGGAATRIARDGSYSLRISGSSSTKRYAWFTVNTSGKAGDVYSIGGWAKANAVANHSANGVTDFKLTAGVHYTDGEYVEFPIDLNENVTDWQYVMQNFIPKKDYNKIKIFGSYNYNCNTAYFDSFFLYRDTAQSYQYDKDGNVISTADYANQQSSFEYTDNNLSKLIEPSGTSYSYKYDDKNNLTNATSNTGTNYSVSYDANGNATHTTITAQNETIDIKDGETYYIRNKNSGFYLSVEGGECIRANVYQKELNEEPIQKWTVKQLPNGCYILRPEGCNEHALGFVNRYIVNTSVNIGVTGENVESIDWSYWLISPNNDIEGSYKLITYTNAYTKYLTAANVSLEGNSDVYMDYGKDADVQKWLFIPANEIDTSTNNQDDADIEKTYYIQNKNSGLYLSVEGEECVRSYMCQQPLRQAPLQEWTVKKLSNGYYIIRPKECNEHALALENRYTPNTASVLGVTGENNESIDWSHWILSPNNDIEGSYKIITSTSAYTPYLTVANSSLEAGSSVYMNYESTSDAQKWFFIPADEETTSPENLEQTYYIRNQNSGQYLTVEGEECVRSNVYQQPLKENLLQKWTIKKLSDGYYIIRPEGCNEHALGFVNRYVVNTSANIGVTGENIDNIDWSHWILSFNNDSEGSYKLITRTSAYTKYLTVANSSLTVGGDVYMDYERNTDNQKWVLIPTNERIISSATYQDNGNYPHTVTNACGNVTTYTYDISRGLQTAIEDANGSEVNYSYNSLNDYLESVMSENSTVNYAYETNGALKEIIAAGGTKYNFTYDSFGRQDTISVAGQVLSDITYLNNYTNLVSRFDYGNGVYKTYTYDDLDRLISESINGEQHRTYLYDKRGNLAQTNELLREVTTKYNYDLIGRIIGIDITDGQKLNYAYDSYNRLLATKWSLEDIVLKTEYEYGNSNIPGQNAGLIYGIKLDDINAIGYTYDMLGRINTRTIHSTIPYVTEYGYLQGIKPGTTTTLVETIKNGNDTLEYLYDAVANITQVKKNGTIIEAYSYDALNQLASATHDGNTYTYFYDNGGNIVEIKKNDVVIKSYTYGNNAWKDQLTAFNGDIITYDEIGNPLTYRNGLSFTWQNGRQLASVAQNGNAIASYTYDADGLRTAKTVNGTTTKYYWMNGMLQGKKTGDEYILFLYDENGIAYGFIYQNDTKKSYYYYEFNLQSDIIGIIDSTGSKVVEYTYGAWGDILSVTGTLADTIGQKNPLRYRGYYYDAETGFYYVSSRYYDPEIGRFLNADSLINQSSVIGNNMFAYCLNNPVNMADNTGHLPFFVITAAIGAVVGAVAGGVIAAKNGKNVWAGIGIGAAAGALIGTGAGMAAGAALAGSITATTGMVTAGATSLVATISTGGLGAGVASVANNLSQATNNLSSADPVKNALKQLDSTGLRPGQTEISRAKVMDIVNSFDITKAQSSIYSNGTTRYLVDGHHTTVASVVAGKGPGMNMGIVTNQLPSATNVYWSRKWYEFGKTVIKIME